MSRSTNQAAIVLDPQSTLDLPLTGVKLIEASAGTGKTYTIGNLYLRYVLAGYGVAEILVVTFTNAATEELRGRIRARLYHALQLLQNPQPSSDAFLDRLLSQASDSDEQQTQINRLKLAVRSMDEAAIFTINGFCQRALTDHAFNSGQAFELALSSDDSELWHSALKDWWRRTAYTLSRQDVGLFNDALGSLENFMALQAPLRQAFDKTLLPKTSGNLQTQFDAWNTVKQDLQAIAEQWLLRNEEIRNILLESKALSRAASGPYKKEKLLISFALLDDWFRDGDLLTLPKEFATLTAALLADKSKPAQRGKDPQLDDEFFHACQQVVDKRQTLLEKLRATALTTASEYASEQVKQAKQQNQTIAFHDQLTLLHDALHDAPHDKTHNEQADILADSLRQRFPLAMIDEFQDTDALQYGIFRKLYFAQDNTSLTMIGDPKQAIYSFRGGDIFTYMRAKADAGDQRYTLDTNWRSVPGLITAVNRIFDFRSEPFIYSQAIDFQAVHSATEADKGSAHKLLKETGNPVPPISLWKIPLTDKQKPQGKSQAQTLLVDATAAEIARLLSASKAGDLTLGEQPLKPGDIAVLVRNSFEGSDIRQQLQRHGIAAVSVGRDKVFESDEASALSLLLQAIIHCNDRGHARSALTSALLAHRYTTIAEIEFSEQHWLVWVDHLRELNRLWLQRGFMAMFHAMLQKLAIGHALAAQENGERRLTNLLHLGELLQQASKTHPGLDALLSWYRQQILEKGDEEAELRLESDEALVKIVTIHKSKGLEYPVVFLPFLWACRGAQFNNKLVAFHDAKNQPFLDSAVHADSAHLLLAEKERLAEDIRLAYVALTRAQAKIYLAWGHVTTQGKCDSGSTALGYLLHAEQTPDDLNLSPPKAITKSTNIGEDLARLAATADSSIEILDLPNITPPTSAHAQMTPSRLSPAVFSGSIASDWRVASFTALTRDIHQVHRGGSPRADDPVLNFPAGSHVGSFLHLLLERLDFQIDIAPQVATLSQRLAPRFGLDVERHRETLEQWITAVIDTPLTSASQATPLRLRDIPNHQRLNEMEFDFSLSGVNISALNKRLQAAAGQTLSPVAIDDFRGMITGVIDLIFAHDGKYYIADYKSNFLGGALSDYVPDKLKQAVLDRRYDLQYLLYTLALHRYLRQRIIDYDYLSHFGGAYYLFLRGMRPDSGADFGVFFDRPDWALIDWMDKQLFSASSPHTTPEDNHE